jgi:hypothetical protein
MAGWRRSIELAVNDVEVAALKEIIPLPELIESEIMGIFC